MFKRFTLTATALLAALALTACTFNPNQNTSDVRVQSVATNQNTADISDTALESNINQSIDNSYPSSRFPHRVQAVVWESKTLLIGQAQNQQLADDIYRIVGQVYGVKTVLNQIEINSQFNPTVSRTVSDSSITALVKSRLALTKGIPSTRIKVITQDSVVFLLSKADAKQTETAAQVAATVSGVSAVKIVTLDN